MPSKQTLNIRIVNCGGMFDQLGELEAQFLVSSLGLFRNVKGPGRGTARANPSLARVYRASDFYDAVAGKIDLLHLIAHASAGRPVRGSRAATAAEIGVGSKRLAAEELRRRARRGLSLPEFVLTTACEMNSSYWLDTLRLLGVKLLIASAAEVTPANLAAFDMAFYSALLSQVRRGASTSDRIRAAFALAQHHYEAVHATGTPHAKFELVIL